ncbi:HlyD family type I secretion periplasmic adaptor subunit [Gymnodinialimonas hymeniacidonis]|uniref:HlyD family type I secretion periplasmic adaptor subunit n=1 Tax=Gymnodinialimonas hymeniacidonis TaxID=3126508 RepID=UPI0034C5FFC2
MTGTSTNWSVARPMWIGVLGIVTLVAGFGSWSVMTTLSGAIIAPGQIVVERNLQTIQHPDGGRVTELLVEEGDRVDASDVLMRLDASAMLTERNVALANLAEIQARRARLAAEHNGFPEVLFPPDLLQRAERDPAVADLLSGQLNLFSIRIEAHERAIAQQQGRITQINAQLRALQAQNEAIAAQISLIESELIRRQDLLARGAGTQDPVVRLQQELAQLRGAIGEVAANEAEAAERIIEGELAILQLETERREQAITELREVRAAEQELIERLDGLETRISRHELRAPIAGRIHGLTIFGEGAVLRPADPFAYLVPEGRPHVISARVAAQHIDQIFPGQEVRLVFSSFNQLELPEILGEVGLISADAFTEDGTGNAFYQIEITLPVDQIALLGDRDLIPGMPVDAFIQTEARPPLIYLIEPFFAYFEHAMRES